MIGNTPEEIREKYSKILGKWENLNRLAYKEPKVKCLDSFARKAFSGLSVFNNLRILTIFNWSPTYHQADFKPEIPEVIEMLEKLMDKLKTSTGGQTFAFGDDSAYNVYWYKQISALKEFKFLKKAPHPIYPVTKSLLTFELLLPFNNKNPDTDCVSVNGLPLFYKNREEFGF